MGKTLMDLFKQKKDIVYNDLGARTIIESYGVVNIPRKTALIVSSPTSLGSLIGNNVGGAVKGSANRPTDTIFNNKSFLSKPISLFPGAITGVKDAVQKETPYYIKKSPGAPNIVSKLKQGASNPKNLLMREGAKLLKSPTSTLKAFKDLTGKLKRSKVELDSYGPEKSETVTGNIITDKGGITFTKYAPIYEKNSKGNWEQIGVKERGKSLNKAQDIIDLILSGKAILENYNQLANNPGKNPYVLITSYPDNTNPIFLPGTITGLEETISPEWSDFKYVGSPFKLYRYGGVERTFGFDLKLYYTTKEQKQNLKRSLNKLKTLAFPDSNLSAAKYEYMDSYAPLTFVPNILYLTIYGWYKNIVCVMEDLSLNVEENTVWPVENNTEDGKLKTRLQTKQNDNNTSSPNRIVIDEIAAADDEPYPSIISVSMRFKILESPEIKTDSNGKTIYEYGDKDTEYFTTGKMIKTAN